MLINLKKYLYSRKIDFPFLRFSYFKRPQIYRKMVHCRTLSGGMFTHRSTNASVNFCLEGLIG